MPLSKDVHPATFLTGKVYNQMGLEMRSKERTHKQQFYSQAGASELGGKGVTELSSSCCQGQTKNLPHAVG